MGKGRKVGREEEPREPIALEGERDEVRADQQRLVWDGDRWESEGQEPEASDEERLRFSVTPLHIGMGLALFAVGVMVPVAAAGLTWWAFRRGSS